MNSAFKFLAILALAAFLPFGANAQAQQAETFKIGFGGALLGDNSSYGLSNLYGVEYAVNQANAKGGLLGRQIELVTEDDGCDPKNGANAALKLVTQGIKLVLGHTCSGATRSALSAYNNQVILISSSATEVTLTEDGASPYFFRTTARDDAQAEAQLAYIRKKGFKKLAIFHDKGDYGLALATKLQNDVKANPGDIEIVLFEGVTTGEVSYEDVVSMLKNSAAEVLVWGGYHSDASKLAIQMRDKGVETVIIGPDGMYDQNFLTMAGPAAEGTIVTGQADISKSEAAQAAIADHHTRHKEETGTYFIYAASAAQALFAAVEKAGTGEDLDLIKKHLTEDTVETIMGPVRFNEKGDVIGAVFALYEVKNGAFVSVSLD
ncbi:MAG: branched-chain amino acid ABC transporter substrate-binding protein [Deltaproteobacteria bacterium]|jgi:branched-chain amino acid transport system substrate-binding protein|nr:branched-chain amino acid ABC transporter substrate-binding protein [Deltaproteobacteria bacterium]